MEDTSIRKIQVQIAGWVIFTLCAVLFLVSSLKNDDLFALMGSILFLIACFFFLIPLIGSLRKIRK